MEEIFEIRSCIEILANDIKVDKLIRICCAVNRAILDWIVLDCAVFYVPSNTV